MFLNFYKQTNKQTNRNWRNEKRKEITNELFKEISSFSMNFRTHASYTWTAQIEYTLSMLYTV